MHAILNRIPVAMFGVIMGSAATGAVGQCNLADLFSIYQQFSTGSSPHSVAIGDLDRDGTPDLATANTNSNSVSVLLGNGDGTFQARQDFSGGPRPYSIAIGDLDGDDNPDLAIATNGLFSTPGNVSVLLGNGDGTFQPLHHFNTNRGPSCVAIGDLNGDSTPDLVIANAGTETVPANSCSVLLGNGDGTFQAHQDYAVGSRPNSVAIGDLDGDGIPDLAVANAGSDTVSVWRGVGDGTFRVRRNYATGDSPKSVAIGDLNEDGTLDLAVANGSSDTVSVLLGNGDGTFQTRQDFAVGDSPYSVAIGDLDGDSIPDLAVANYSSDSVSVLLGNGDGTFQIRQNFAVGDSPYSVAIGDLDGDSMFDLAFANYIPATASVLLNRCKASGPCSIADLAEPFGELSFFDVSAFLTAFSTSDPVADINADGLFNFFDISAFLTAFNAGCP